MSVYDTNAFNERVNFAAGYISAKRSTTRRFDTCFEMYDGDAVAVALVRRAEANPHGKLAANLYSYLSRETVAKTAQKFRTIPTKHLPLLAQELRAKAKRDFEEFLAKQG